MEPARAALKAEELNLYDTFNLNRQLAGARAALAVARGRIRKYEDYAAEQLAVIQDVRRQMYLLGIKEQV